MTSVALAGLRLTVAAVAVVATLALVGCGTEERTAANGTTNAEPTSTEGRPSTTDDGQNRTGPEDGEDTTEPEQPGGDEGDDDVQPSTTNEVRLGPLFRRVELNFGVVAVGSSSSPKALVIRNLMVPRTLTELAVVGKQSGDFSITRGDCAEGIQLAPDATCDIVLTFTPSAEGSRTAELRISADPRAGVTVPLEGGTVSGPERSETIPDDPAVVTG